MRLIRLKAHSPREALKQVKAALGPDALVLEVIRRGGGVEVLAAAEREELVAEPPGAPPRSLRAALSEDPMTRSLRIGLERAGFTSSVARDLSVGAKGQRDEFAALRDAVSRRIPTIDPMESGGPIILFGARESGRTTAAAMIGARAALTRGRKVAFIEASGRATPHPLLAACSRLLEAAHTLVRRCGEVVPVASSIRDRLVIVDLGLCHPLISEGAKELGRLRVALPSALFLLVAGADAPLLLQAEIRSLPPSVLSGVGITRIDLPEAGLGAALSALIECGPPAAFFTSGREIPQSLVPASPEAAARLALRSIGASAPPSHRLARGPAAAREIIHA